VTEALHALNGPKGWSLEIQQARLDGLKKAMQGRRYDLEVMPKRELTARATVRISLLVLGQRAPELSLSNGVVIRSSISSFNATKAFRSQLVRRTSKWPGVPDRLLRPLCATVRRCEPLPS
jgi:hypothetical protein